MKNTCSNQVPFCRVRMCPCDHIGCEHTCKLHAVDCGGENVPSFAQWIPLFTEAAKERNAKTGQLEKAVVGNILSSLKDFKERMGFADDAPVSVINRKSLAAYCEKLTCRGITKIGKCQTIRQAFAKWARLAFEDAWELPQFDMPDIVDDSKRFTEPSPEMRLSVAKWYRSLLGRGRGKCLNRDRLFAMFMYKLAMRNGDVARLKWSNIEKVGGKYYLAYTPHKTRLSSKRSVKVALDTMDADDLMDYKARVGGEYIFGGGKCGELCRRLNGELRAIGVEGSKGMYLLRKLAINAVYKEAGREAASAISGDDFSTIKYHYADVSAVKVSALPENAYL